MRFAACVVALGLTLLPAMGEESRPAETISPEWGAVLYDVYSNRPLPALTRLLAREKQGLWKGSENARAQALTAAMLIDLGLPRTASERLERIASDSLQSQQRSRLMMFMARQFYLNQQWDAADRWLHRADPETLDDSEKQRWAFLKGQIAFARGEYQPAAQWFQQAQADQRWTMFGQYNRGIALLRDTDASRRQEGQTVLASMLSLPLDDDEAAAVRDKALLALGWHNLVQANQPESAVRHLLQVRKESPVAREALLLLGWGLTREGRYQEALSAWTHLSTIDDPLHPAIQEAWLAAPYARQKLGDLQGALDGYRQARVRAHEALDKLQEMEKNRFWLTLWEENDKAASAADLTMLQYVASDGPMLKLLQRWERLSAWQERLAYAKRTVPVLRWAVRARALRFEQHQALARRKLTEIPFEDLDKQARALQARWGRSAQGFCVPDEWSPPLDAACRRLLKAEALLQALPEEQRGDRLVRLRRLAGVFLWKAVRQRPDDRWKIEKALKRLEAERRRLATRKAGLLALLSRQQPPIEPVLERLRGLEEQAVVAEAGFDRVRERMLSAMDDRFRVLAARYRQSLQSIQRQAQLALARLEYMGAADDVEKEKQP